MTIRAPKDFWSGVMFIAFAVVALMAARGYSLGTAGKMGPGYFPLLLGAVLALIGAVLVGRSFVLVGERVGGLSLLSLLLITGAIVLFGVSIETFGVVIALVLVTVMSASASRQSRILETCLLATVLAAITVGIFAYGLRLPLPVWPVF